MANGCADPSRLQAICDRLGPAEVQAFFDRWTAVIPTPFTPADRAAGYWWQLSTRQIEVSRTLVFDDRRRARGFFESLVADNVGIGRPHEVSVVFARQVRTTTKEPFRSRIFSAGTDVKLDFAYKHCRVKQYLKEGRAYRIETVVNKPADLGVLARLEHLPELVAKARAVNQRVCLPSNVPARAVPSGPRCSSAPTSPTTGRANEPEPCASGITAPWPWPARCASSSTPSPASPTTAFAGSSPDSTAPTTPPTR